MHYHYRNQNLHLDFLNRARYNIVKMFTPPKSKSPWEAMTAGSTGGWAKGLESWGGVGPALTGAAGVLLAPFTGGMSLPISAALSAGMGAAGMAGKGTGFQGTDKGWGNLAPTLLGTAAGYGLGSLGAGAAGGLQSAMAGGGKGLLSNLTTGFGSGMKAYNAPLTGMINKLGKSVGFGGTGGYTTEQNFVKNAAGQWIPTGAEEMVSGGKGGLWGAGQNLLGGVLSNITGGSTGNPADFNLGNIASLVMGGPSALAGWNNMGGAPQLQRNRDEAYGYINTPDLVQARAMIKDLAMKSPSELISPAGDEFVNASLRQFREGVQKQQRLAIDQYAARGQILGKSGSVDKYIRESDNAALQRESDYIAQINESRMLAATKMKVDAVSNYFNVSAQEAAQLLAAEGYVNPIDMQNYLAAMQEYQTAQQLSGYMQLAPMLQGG